MLLFATSLSAQDVKFGFKAGMNIPNVSVAGTKTPMSEGYASKAAVGAGLFTELKCTDHFYFRFGVDYSGQGGKKDGLQAMPTSRLLSSVASGSSALSANPSLIAALTSMQQALPQYYYANLTNKTTFDYVMIPLLAQWAFSFKDSGWDFYFHAGPFVSFLVSSKLKSSGSSSMYADASGTTLLWDTLDPTIQTALETALPDLATTMKSPMEYGTSNITSEMRTTNVGLMAGIGFRYQANHNYFFAELSGNYGLIPVQSEKTNGQNRLGALSIQLGYAIKLFQ